MLIFFPVVTFLISTVPYPPEIAEASWVPSGENATEVVDNPPGPWNVLIFLPVETFHSLTIPPNSPEASVVPSGENATEVTGDLRCVELGARPEKI